MRGPKTRIELLLLCVACPALLFIAGKNHAAARSKPFAATAVSATMMPQIFQEGIISTAEDEVNGSFSPDGSEYYFSVVNQYTTGPEVGIICVSYRKNGKWSQPVALLFSALHLDFGPRISPDGQTMYFTSTRAIPGKREGSIGIWSASRTQAGWDQPKPLPAPINTPDGHANLEASVAKNGNIYFSSSREGKGHLHIYRSEFVDGHYKEPEKLGPEINSDFHETDPYVSADEQMLIFASSGTGLPQALARPDTLQGGGVRYARADLYISTKQQGEWTQARHLENGINTTADEGSPSLSPDGKYLFFTSERSPVTVPAAHPFGSAELERQLHSVLNGHGNIFCISTKALEIGAQQ